jgi:alpha-N-arabinofuranosidase
VTEHWYDRAEQRPGAPPEVELQEWTRSPANQVRAKAVQWDMYRERFPWIDEKRIALWIDEYAYTGGPANLKQALAYGMVLQEMLRHSDFLAGAAFTTGSSTMDIAPNAAALNTTGLVFKFYGENFGAGTIPLAVSGDVPVPELRFAMGAEHPLTVSGSPTYPLDVVAGLSPDRSTLRIAVVNAGFEPQRMALEVAHGAVTGPATVRTLTGASLEAQNRLGAAPEVSITQSAAREARSIEVPPLSISVVTFPFAAAD